MNFHLCSQILCLRSSDVQSKPEQERRHLSSFYEMIIAHTISNRCLHGFFLLHQVVSIDGTDVQGKSVQEAKRLILGPEGSTIVIGLRRAEGGEYVSISLTRQL